MIRIATGLLISLVLATVAASAVRAAQAPETIPRIGLLFATPPVSTRAVEAFRQGLRELGYVEGRNVALEYRMAAPDRPEQLPELAADLVRLNVRVIVAQTTVHARAAKQATSTIPVVMGAVSDPVGSGLVASLAHPEANVTGLSLLAPEAATKSLELLKAAVPGLVRVAALYAPGSASGLRAATAAATTLGVQLQPIEVRPAGEFEPAFETARAAGAQGVIAIPHQLFAAYRARLAELALRHRLPAASIETGFAEAGGLLSYGPNIPDSHRRAAVYVDRLLKGAKPGDLPVEQPTKFDLVVNLKTAKTLGLTIPQSVLLRASEVIQ